MKPENFGETYLTIHIDTLSPFMNLYGLKARMGPSMKSAPRRSLKVVIETVGLPGSGFEFM